MDIKVVLNGCQENFVAYGYYASRWMGFAAVFSDGASARMHQWLVQKRREKPKTDPFLGLPADPN